MAALVATATACSSAPVQAGYSSGPPGGTPSVTLPLERYLFTARETNLLDSVFAAVTRQCMARFGFSYDDTSPPGVEIGLLDRRYGVTDAHSVATYGYHLPPDSPQAIAAANAARYHRPHRGPDESRVLTGLAAGAGTPQPSAQDAGSYRGVRIPSGGCLGEARTALAENGPGSDFSLVDELNVDSFGRSQQTSPAREAIARWSRCMSSAGYRFPTPLAAAGSFDLNTATPSTAEIRTAEADVDCKSRTGLTTAWTETEIAIQRASIHAHLPQLTLIRDRMDSQLRAATSLRAGGQVR